jgi:NAD(P)H dehydrogenase (quinone)
MVGDTLTRLLNRHVRMELVAREDRESVFRSAGMKNPAPRILMLDGFSDGWIEFESGRVGSRKTKISLAEALRLLVERELSSGSKQQ